LKIHDYTILEIKTIEMKHKLTLLLLLLTITTKAQNFYVGIGATTHSSNKSICADMGAIGKNNIIYKLEYCRNIKHDNDVYNQNALSFGVGQKNKTNYIVVLVGVGNSKELSNNEYVNKISYNLGGEFGLIFQRKYSIAAYISSHNGVGIKLGYFFGGRFF
jgi:hypothetical protein